MARQQISELRDARNAIWDMRAVELEGRDLAEALEGSVRSVMAGASVALDVTVRGDRRPLQPLVETTVLRIGREAVLNALKHRPRAKSKCDSSMRLGFWSWRSSMIAEELLRGRRRPRRATATSGSLACALAWVAPEAR